MAKIVRSGKYLFIFLHLALMIAAPVFAADGPVSRPRLAVYDFANGTGSPAYDAACGRAARSLLFTLRQLARHEIEVVSGTAEKTEAELSEAAFRRRTDYALFGDIFTTRERRVVCRLALFDRSKGRTTIVRESPPVESLDLLEAVDAVIDGVLGEITGGHIGFGRLGFEPSGGDIEYRVFLDGLEAGENLTMLERVLAGPHTISIVQKRMLGDTEIAHAAFELVEDTVYRCSFTPPLLTDDEKAKLDGAERDIRMGWESPAAAEATAAKLAELEALLAEVSNDPRLADLRANAQRLRAEWAMLKNRFRIEERAWDPEASLLEPDIAVYEASISLPDSEGLKRRLTSNAKVLTRLLELQAARYMSAGRYVRAGEVHESIATLYGYLSDEKKKSHIAFLERLGPLVEVPLAETAQYREKLERVYGRELAAATRFNGLELVAKNGGAPVLIAEEPDVAFSVGDGKPEAYAVLLPAGSAAVPVSVTSGGRTTFLAVPVPEGRRLVFLDVSVLPSRENERGGSGARSGSAGWSQGDPIDLPRRTIKMNADAAEWDGIEPIITGHFSGVGLLSKGGYALTKVYMCRDDKNLYWRLDFADVNVFVDTIEGKKDERIVASLCVQSSFAKLVKISLERRTRKNAFEGYMEHWAIGDQRRIKQEKKRFAWVNGADFIEFSISLAEMDKFAKGSLPLYVSVTNPRRGQALGPGGIQSSVCFVRF